MRNKFRSVRQKVLLFGFLMTIIPLVLISVYYLTDLTDYVGSTSEEIQEMRLHNLAGDIRSDIRQVTHQLDILAALDQPENDQGAFYEVLRSMPAIDSLVMLDAEGMVSSEIARNALNHRRTGTSWFQGDALEPDGTNLSEVLFNDYGQPYLQMVTSYGDGGYIGASVQLQKLIGSVSSYQLNDETVIYLQDHTGQIIAHQDYSRLWQSDVDEIEDGIHMRTAIDEVDWELVMDQPRREAMTPVFDMMRRGAFTATVMILFGSVISVFAGLYFVKPIEQLQRGMLRMKTDDRPETMPVERSDELGELTESFNEMNETIQEKEQRLRQEKERLDIVVNSMDAGLAVVRKDYSIAWLNPKLRGWIGEKTTVPCFKLFNDSDTPCYSCPLGETNPFEKMDEVLTRTDETGQERVYRHRVFPLQYTLEQDEEALIVMEDITEERLMEEKIIQTDKLSALGLMASSFAHEVNNPLASVQVYAEDLSDRLTGNQQELLDSGDMAHYLSIIRKNIDRCKTITANLLNFSRKEHWQDTHLNIRQVADDSLMLMDHSLKKSGVQVHVDEETDMPLITGDAMKLSQVFVNLIQNAIDAIADKEEGTLTIRLFQAAGEVVAEVHDNGTGIPQTDFDKLFDPFFTSKPTGKGTGLGLSVCYGIVQQMKGTMEVESQVGQGSTFRIRLPGQAGNLKNVRQMEE
ncbi:PAS domain-containing sensor histidine kinase [Salisediminibacterium beveridgei]|uniref:histidine kinase n=1 Tax=Salisediminibacterium beveridgei TaxID=632773 RepID=A0A1D7QYN1_9BACI|nr:PAS domain-containing sensor histidine kinase [Salisediminibacterium beveridgei]AOM84110.1 PAS/PAC sensor hybrid histidine kinase [Salisediminibacterium beveridgei]